MFSLIHLSLHKSKKKYRMHKNRKSGFAPPKPPRDTSSASNLKAKLLGRDRKSKFQILDHDEHEWEDHHEEGVAGLSLGDVGGGGGKKGKERDPNRDSGKEFNTGNFGGSSGGSSGESDGELIFVGLKEKEGKGISIDTEKAIFKMLRESIMFREGPDLGLDGEGEKSPPVPSWVLEGRVGGEGGSGNSKMVKDPASSSPKEEKRKSALNNGFARNPERVLSKDFGSPTSTAD